MKPGWEAKRLGELCRIELGSTPARDRSDYWDSERKTENVWLSIADLPQSLHAVAVDSKEYVSEVAARTMRLVPAGTLLASFKLTLGRLAYAGRNLFTNEAIASLLDIDDSVLSREFLYWALSAFDWDKAAEGDQKVKGKTLNKAKLQLIPIEVPPLDEQQRIVEILNEAVGALARARAHTDTNLRDVKVLFERSQTIALSERRETSESNGGEEWPEVELKQLVSFHNGDRGKNYPNKNEYVTEGIPWLNTGHIMPDGSLSATKMNFISPAKFQTLGGGRIQRGDLVFCLRGATIGKTAFVEPYQTGAVASSLMIIRPGKAIMDRYLYYFLTSSLGKAEIDKFIGGAAQPNLAGESVGRFRLRLPPVAEQERIAERLDRLKDAREALELSYRARLADIESLRQSLLRKAFSGELTS